MKKLYGGIFLLVQFCTNSFAQLSGVYTIGGTSPSYPDIATAINDLAAQGVNGSVTFNIRPGTYTTSVVIGSIPGVSAANNVVIQSEVADSSSVILIPSNRYVFYLNNASHLTVRKLQFSNYNNKTAIIFKSGNSNITISNNYFKGEISSTAAIYDESGLNNYNIKVSNNFIYWGVSGVELKSQSSKYVTICDNKFDKQRGTSVVIEYSVGSEITRNIFTNNTAYGIQTLLCDSLKILRNSISGSGFGIDYGGSHNSLLANNMIYLKNLSYYCQGIIVGNNSNKTHAVGNTVYIECPYGGVAFLLRGNGTVDSTCVLMNNIFLSKSPSGYAYIQDNAIIPKIMDYNILESSGTYLAMVDYSAYSYSTLAAFQQATGQNLNSKEYWPLFVSATDLHIKSEDCQANQAGTYYAGHTNDIDGDLRDINNPDIGADEFAATPYYFASATINQKGGYVGAGVINFPVMKFELNIDGCVSGLSAKQFDFNTLGTNNTANLTKAKVFYTGTSSLFDTTQRFGNIIISPNGSFSITGNQVLSKGKNFFWLSYDLSPGAVNGDIVDASIIQYFLDTNKVTPAASSLVGNYIIKACMPNEGSIAQTIHCGYNKLNSIPKNALMYKWSSGQITQNITVLSSGTYSVAIMDSIGCYQSANINVTVRQPLSVSTNTVTPICVGDTVVLSATSLLDVSYHWKNPDTVLYTNTYTVSPLQTTKYMLVVTDTISGCTAKDSITVTVVPIDAAIIKSGPTRFCSSGSVIFTATVNTSYLWSTGAVSQAITVNNAGKYWVKVTNSAGCKKTSDTIEVIVDVPPAAPVIFGDTIICSGDSILLKTTKHDSAELVQWYLNGNIIAGAVDTAYWAVVGGSYTVKLTNSCSGTFSSPLKVSVKTAVSMFTASSNTLDLLVSNSVSFTNNSSPGSYSWNFGDGGTSSTSSPSHIFLSPGTYVVTLTVTNSVCTDIYYQSIVAVNGIPCIYDNNNVIVPTGSMKHVRQSHETVVLNSGIVLSIAGAYYEFPFVVGTSCELYNYNTGQWSFTDSMNYERSHFEAIKLNDGNILAVGGINSSGVLQKTTEIFDVGSQQWQAKALLKEGRTNFEAFVLPDGKILTIGGGDLYHMYSKTCEIYDPVNNTWNFTDSLEYPRAYYAAVKLQNGNIFITGGGNRKAEIFDVSTKTWRTLKDSLQHSNYSSTVKIGAVLLHSGKVLITGGNTTNCELFDPGTETFTIVANTNNLTSQDPILLADGKALIYGIGDPFVANSQVVEIYDPVNNIWYGISPSSSDWNTCGAVGATYVLLPNSKVLLSGGIRNVNTLYKNTYLLNCDLNTASPDNSETDKFSASVFPNPGEGLFNIRINRNNLKQCRISVYNVLGSIFYDKIASSDHNVIDLSTYSKGVYFIKITSETGEVIYVDRIIYR